MGLFGRKKVKNQIDMTYDEFQTFYANSSDDNALKLSAVYSAISLISNTMSKIPFSVINRFTKEEVTNTNLYEILNYQPHPDINAVDMHKMEGVKLLTEGEYFLYPVREYRSLNIKYLHPLSKSEVNKIKDDNGKLWYRFQFNGREKMVDYSDIIHRKEFTLNGTDGLSPLEFARQTTIATGLNQETYTKDFYENYGRPFDYLETPNNISDKKIVINIQMPDGTIQQQEMSYKDYMRYEWEKAHKGKNRGKIAILDNGLKYGTVPQITPEQMEFTASKLSNVEDVARIFDMGACAFKLGIGKQTYSNNEQGQICYITDTIIPRLRKWETELTLKLLTREERAKGYVIKGNINAELRGDTATQANWLDKMRSMGVYNINEMRDILDMPSIGEMGETRLIGANSIPLERLLAGETAASATPNDLEEESIDE